MVIGILALFIKVPGYGNHLPVPHVKTGILQLVHIVQIHKVTLMAAQELGMGFQNQAVNGLLQEYAARARQDGVEFTARVDLSAHVPVDDLTLCIVTGNLLENALEACRRLTGPRFILVQARWLDDHLMMLVENSYNGQIKKNGSRILSSKRDGGLGILSIKRILNQPGDEFDVDYNDTTFTAMVKIVDRALA